jgi:hypothetical protein
MTPVLVFVLFVAGTVAGVMGALLGLGGGVFLVPFLVLVMRLPMHLAVGISLTTVIATSSVVSSGRMGRSLVNLRLGMVLEVATAAGGRGYFEHHPESEVDEGSPHPAGRDDARRGDDSRQADANREVHRQTHDENQERNQEDAAAEAEQRAHDAGHGSGDEEDEDKHRSHGIGRCFGFWRAEMTGL